MQLEVTAKGRKQEPPHEHKNYPLVKLLCQIALKASLFICYQESPTAGSIVNTINPTGHPPVWSPPSFLNGINAWLFLSMTAQKTNLTSTRLCMIIFDGYWSKMTSNYFPIGNWSSTVENLYFANKNVFSNSSALHGFHSNILIKITRIYLCMGFRPIVTTMSNVTNVRAGKRHESHAQ